MFSVKVRVNDGDNWRHEGNFESWAEALSVFNRWGQWDDVAIYEDGEMIAFQALYCHQVDDIDNDPGFWRV